METSGFKILIVAVLFNWFFAGYLIHLAELRHNVVNTSEDGVADILSALWLAPITFTTIGYGDFSPKSIWGRIFAIYLGLLGALCTSITVTIMNDALQMNRREKMMYCTLRKDALEKNIRHAAAVVIQRIFRARKKAKDSGKLVIEPPTKFVAKILPYSAAVDLDTESNKKEVLMKHSMGQMLVI